MRRIFFIGVVLLLPLIFCFLLIFYFQTLLQKPTIHNSVQQLNWLDGNLFSLENGWLHEETNTFTSLPTTIKTDQTVTLTTSLSGLEVDKIYSFDFNGIYEAFELSINGEMITNKPNYTANKLIHLVAKDEVLHVKIVIVPTNGRVSLLQTPVIGPVDSVQTYYFTKKLFIILTLIALTVLGIYYVMLYISKRTDQLYLAIGIYFLFVSVSLFVSKEGPGLALLPQSHTVLTKLTTITGLLSTIPMYVVVTTLTEKTTTQWKTFSVSFVILLSSVFIVFLPVEMYRPFEVLIWCCLIIILFIYVVQTIFHAIRNRLSSLKHLFLINSMLYLLVYLCLRVYYVAFGTNLPTSLWLVIFTFSIFIYLTLHQNQLVKNLEQSKQEVIQSKISFFNAQIKPHFLYNALSNIMALCYTDNLKAAHLLGMFSTYLRIIFENNIQHEWISLQKELSLIEAYVEIEKARFPDKILFETEIDDHLSSVKIPTLSIQPFVENAIRHGLFNQQKRGTVRLQINRREQFLMITITDNGIGMEREHLQQIIEGKKLEQGIGIQNVLERFQYIEHSKLEIQSVLHEGTIVKLQIPIKTS